MYLKEGLLKCELGLGRGKKTHDKRAAIQEREIERETRAAMHQRNLRTRFD
jgi:SsrA-binding protein